MPALKDARLRAYVKEVGGDAGIALAKLLDDLGEATDTELAERLGEKPSRVRKVLYDLYEARIAEYYQKKDKETGWQTFHWRLSPENALRAREGQRRKRLEELEERLRREEGTESYACRAHPDGRRDFEGASEAGFRCPECGGALEAEDKRALLRSLKQEIEALRKALAS